MTKIYKTAKGREVDIERLALKNEKVRAVGNMNVNARGDVIDNSNKVTSSRSAQVNKGYRKQIGNVPEDIPVVSSKKRADELAQAAEKLVGLDEAKPVAPVAKTKSVKAKAKTKKAGGLAGAIAKTKEAE